MRYGIPESTFLAHQVILEGISSPARLLKLMCRNTSSKFPSCLPAKLNPLNAGHSAATVDVWYIMRLLMCLPSPARMTMDRSQIDLNAWYPESWPAQQSGRRDKPKAKGEAKNNFMAKLDWPASGFFSLWRSCLPLSDALGIATVT